MRIRDLLAEARRRDDGAVVLEERAVRLTVRDHLADTEDDQGVPHTAHDGEDEEHPQRGGQLTGEG